MKLVDQLQKESKKQIGRIHYSLFNTIEAQKDEMIEHIRDYYYNVDHYMYLFTDGEIAFLESDFNGSNKNKLFSNEINDLKKKYMIYYDSKSKSYQLVDDLVDIYYEYRKKYSKEEREKYGLYRFLVIAYANAYGMLTEDQLHHLFKDFYFDFDIDELIACINESNLYQNSIIKKKYDGLTYYCCNRGNFADLALDIMPESFTDEFAVLEEEALLAYYYDGYDSSNPSIYELRELLRLYKRKREEFEDLIIFTYGLLQPKQFLQSFILERLRFDEGVRDEDIIHAFELVEEIYRGYGSWLTKGFSPEKVEHIIEQNFEKMKEELEEQGVMDLIKQKEEGPIN